MQNHSTRNKCFPDLQEKYLADPKSGPCPFFKPGDTFLLKRTPQQDDFYHLMNGRFCGEAWDAVSRYVYTALQGGSIMKGWTNDDRMMIACCNDGTRPVIFKIERIDIPESDEEREWLAQRDFNHPSVVLYSVGNEAAEPAEPKGVEAGQRMIDLLHILDPTRPVTCGVNLMILGRAAKGRGIYQDGEQKTAGKKQSEKSGEPKNASLAFNMPDT